MVKGLAAYCGLLTMIVALFLLVPGLDLAMSRAFYDPHQGFFLTAWPPVRFIHVGIPWMTRGIVVLALIASAWLFVSGRPIWRLDRKALLFIVMSMALGPGLLTNTVLKDHWGRARPSQIEPFGGTKEFTPAPLRADQCLHNCSFVSGHAALGFSLVAFAFLLPPGRRRWVGQTAAIAFGAVVGLARIAEGAHFLSDVVYAGLLVYGTSWLLCRWIVEQDRLATPAPLRLYRALGGATGVACRRAAQLYEFPAGRMGLWAAGIAILAALAMMFIDEPLARYFHAQNQALSALFQPITLLGLGYPYLLLSGLAYIALRWGGAAPRLRPLAARMRDAAWIPLFLLISIGGSGLFVDVLKVILGRTRPKLLFTQGTDYFSGLAFRADHWSFPSGHTTTIAAVMTALWLLWPRHVLLYIVIAVIVAASRLVIGAHYLSDDIIGGFVGVLSTRVIWFYAQRRPVIHRS